MLDLGVKPLHIRLHWFSIIRTKAAIGLSLEETPTHYYFSVSAGRPPLGQMPYIVTPEGKTWHSLVQLRSTSAKKEGCIERNLLISISLHKRTIGTVWGTICPWVSGEGIRNAPSWLDSSDRHREKYLIKDRRFHLVIPNVNWGQKRWQKITWHMFSMSFSAFFVAIWVAWNWHPSIIQYLTLTFGIKRCKLFF